MSGRIVMEVDKKRWRVSLLPGQIVLVSTSDREGIPNVAPKSWISMVSFSPPILGFGCNLKHQTARNVLEVKQFVVNIPDKSLAQKVWKTGESPHKGAASIKKLGFSLVSSNKISAPGIQECKAQLECAYESDKRFGDELWIFGRILSVSADKTLIQGSSQERYSRLSPIFYLEQNTYGTLGEVKNLQP